MNNAPCYKCKKRTPECHGSCEDYKQWKSDHDEIKSKIEESRRLACADIEYGINLRKRIDRAAKSGFRKQKGW